MPSRAILVADARACAWLQHTAWPIWLKYGLDRRRNCSGWGFHEHLNLRTYRCSANFRRLRVAARQIYVFSKAMIGGLPGAAEAVALGLEYLRQHAVDTAGGYFSRFNLAGKVLDYKRDLYDHAFVLLALASAMQVLPSETIRAEVQTLDAYIQAAFAHPAGGYIESLPPSLPRRQNPHMHLLEAYLAAAEVFGAVPFMDRADNLVHLFLTRFCQAEDAVLAEYFDDDLVAHRVAGRFVAEPGHHAEWVSLLDSHMRLSTSYGRPLQAGETTAVTRLIRFYHEDGRQTDTNALMDELWSDGTVRTQSQRLWPQTERLRAEVLRPNATERSIMNAYRVLEKYIAAAPEGLWMERRGVNNFFVDEPAPASSLYHLTTGILGAHSALVRRGFIVSS